MEVVKQQLKDLERRMDVVEGMVPMIAETHGDVRVLSTELANLSKSVEKLDRNITAERASREEAQEEDRKTSLGEKTAIIASSGAVLAALILAAAQLFGHS